MLERKDIGIFIVFTTVFFYFLSNSFFYSIANLTGYGDLIRTPSDINKSFIIYIGCILSQYLGQLLYLVLAGAGIAFMSCVAVIRQFKLFLLIIFLCFTLIAYAQIQPFFIHGRYIDHLVPLILIPAFFYKSEHKKYDLIIGFAASLISCVAFYMYWRDTINSFSNLYLFISIYALFVLFVGFFIFLYSVRDNKKLTLAIFTILLITFSGSNALNFHYVKTASDNAYNHCLIGRYISENKLEGVVFDIEDQESWWASYCLLSYYYGKKMPLGSEGRYFISSKKLNYLVLVSDERFSKMEIERSGILYLYNEQCTKVSKLS